MRLVQSEQDRKAVIALVWSFATRDVDNMVLKSSLLISI